MSLRNSLYHIIDQGDCSFTVCFDQSHAIFGGHFPGHPIVPGACLVQIAQELKSLALGRDILFSAVRNLKFRLPVTPDIQVRYTIHDDKYQIEDLEAKEIYAQFAATYMCAHSDLQ